MKATTKLKETVRDWILPYRKSTRGANLMAYLNAATGMGEAGRSTLRALRACEYPVWTHALPEATNEFPPAAPPTRGPHPFNLFQVNADVTPHIFQSMGTRFFAERKTVGLWSWEMAEFPPEWHDRFGHVQEVWVPSEYIRAALQPVSPIPVHRMPHVVEPVESRTATRETSGLPHDKFLFLFAFDALSVVERKNPFAVIEAYKQAFGPHPEKTTLVIKVNNRSLVEGDTARYLGVPEHFGQELAARVQGVEGILLDTRLDRAGAHALIQLCDCYVSLHRCEGFGLTMAEAMYFGKPCIATAYSANLDFMNARNSYLVEARMVGLERDYGPYRAGWTWAEPIIDRAAAWMQHVVKHPEDGAARGAQAACDVRTVYNAHRVGTRMVEQLDRLAAGRE